MGHAISEAEIEAGTLLRTILVSEQVGLTGKRTLTLHPEADFPQPTQCGHQGHRRRFSKADVSRLSAISAWSEGQSFLQRNAFLDQSQSAPALSGIGASTVHTKPRGR